MKNDSVQMRRAIEALRSGVPNGDAVRVLGSNQPHIEAEFSKRLALAASGTPQRGLVFAGDFGSGKSHLIEYLQHQANEQGYVTSKVVISKETPLHDAAKVFTTAIDNARVPGRRGAALTEIAEQLDSTACENLRRWTSSSGAVLDDRFAATLYLHENLRGDPEFGDRIIRFWSGDTISVVDLKRELRACGEAATWTFPTVPAPMLAQQRFRFVARLMHAAGYRGWVLFFDEVELIARYSLLQRARSYAEIGRWIQGDASSPIAEILTVMALTPDLDAAIHEKDDYEKAPNRLRARGTTEDDAAASRAEVGIRIMERERMLLASADRDTLRDVHQTLREIYERAFGWLPPEQSSIGGLGTRPMRQYVRSWINEWDLRRSDPSYVPDIEIERVAIDLKEDEDLERPGEPE